MLSQYANNRDLYQISNSYCHDDDDLNIANYFTYSSTLQFKNDIYRYKIERILPYNSNEYCRDPEGNSFFACIEEALYHRSPALRRAATLEARDRIMQASIASCRVLLVTGKNHAIPLQNLKFNSRWGHAGCIKETIINLFKSYVPSYSIFGMFKQPQNIIQAREIIHTLSTQGLNDNDMLAYLRQVATDFNIVSPQGEFNRKLHFAIRMLSSTAERVESPEPGMQRPTLD